MSFRPSTATQLLETARKIQRKLEVFQANLAGQVQRIWDQREPKEPDEVDPSPAPAAPLRPPLSAVTVPRPVVPVSLAWKVTII